MGFGLFIRDVRDKIKEYPQAPPENFLTMSDYLAKAKLFLLKQNADLSRQLMQDEDAISFIAESMMIADWAWKPGGMSRRNYRLACARWALKVFLKTTKRELVKGVLSLNFEIGDDGSTNDSLMVDENAPAPDDAARAAERKRKVEFLLHNSGLTSIQADYVRHHYLEGLTLSEIARKMGVSKQDVRNHVQSAIFKLQRTVEDTHVNR